ncbi:hypothetical protein K432DRAFT_343183 [Lepidopterella palustris CBS 459.81]|uniref:Solute carrier family 40 member n=1 Tax=Lepidopterella palustris CBS 459.81 TaxID=1314670 RepID=A0A8E2JJX7_9PEZI|nr:hypothetical protein K432DRAFT_343183 [Lepidopterella palustris CBS 459.81]
MLQQGLQHGMNRSQAYTLYLCHTLSTWNARSYEFAAVLFTAAAYPGGLRATSFIGISISLAAIIFASALGRWIDQAPSRLRTLLTTIVVNRCAIVCSCLGWFLIVGGSNAKLRKRDDEKNDTTDTDAALRGAAKTIVFAVVLTLGVFENLSRRANVISMERDWVPILAPETGPECFTLTQINATMARIDMVCKLIAPIIISGFLSVAPSVRFGVVCIAAANILSTFLEIWSAKWLWDQCDILRKPKLSAILEFDSEGNFETRHRSESQASRITFFQAWVDSITSWWHGYIPSLKLFFATEVWIPSMSMSILHSSVLSVTGTVIVFLLNSGLSLKGVVLAEAASSAFEIGSTFLAPIAVRKLSINISSSSHQLVDVSHKEDEETLSDIDSDISDLDPEDPLSKDDTMPDINAGVTRLGLWGVFEMFMTLAPTVPLLYHLTSILPYPLPPSSASPPLGSHPLLMFTLLALLSASRFGRGLFSLSTQQLAQARVPAHQRSSFAGTEMAFVSLFGLSHHVGAAIWSKPQQFGWLALGSAVAVGMSLVMFSWWARGERGHLVHLGWMGWWWRERRGKYEGVGQESE